MNLDFESQGGVEDQIAFWTWRKEIQVENSSQSTAGDLASNYFYLFITNIYILPDLRSATESTQGHPLHTFYFLQQTWETSG